MPMPVAAAESLRSQTHRRMTLLAADEFWFAPNLVDAMPPAKADVLDTEGGDDHSDDDFMPALSMPPAHRQLLSDEPASYEWLKGCDHAADVPRTITDGYITSVSDDDEPSAPSMCKERLSDVKERGGGSWLLGFALRHEGRAVSDIVPSCEELECGSDDVPGLVRAADDDSSLDSEETASLAYSDDEASETEAPAPARRRGVTFCESVAIQPVPHSSTLSPRQRSRMFSSSAEVRRNKARAKVEWRYDGCDWRNATEEREMGVDVVTGELVHPAHEARWDEP